MNKLRLRVWEKGAITGSLVYLGLAFLSSMVLDNGHLYIYINSVGEGWIESILLCYLAVRSVWSWFER